MAKKNRFVQGDTRPQLKFSVTDPSTGEPIDLSTATVLFKMREVGSDVTKESIPCVKLAGKVNEDETIDLSPPYDVSGAGGRCAMNWTPTALDAPGDFESELEITFNDGTVQTAYDFIKFTVRPQLA